MFPHLCVSGVTASTALRSLQDSCPTWLLPMTLVYEKISKFDDSPVFVCLFSDDTCSCFLETFPWPGALHSHTNRCNNSSCIRNPTLAAICLLVSATMHWQFVLVRPYTILIGMQNMLNQSHDLWTSFYNLIPAIHDPSKRNQKICWLSPYAVSETCGKVCHLVLCYTVTSTSWHELLRTVRMKSDSPDPLVPRWPNKNTVLNHNR